MLCWISYTMYTWTVLLFYLLQVNCESSSEAGEAYYECGPHGRFEYCINGIPGCVVGCHCHPGYYFDTDTKICEPNIKLSKNYRRQFMEEPVFQGSVPVPTMHSIPTPTSTNPIDAKVDAIAKDTDDLGDWLYNQFFKTIENQVINSTDSDPRTRRSGSEVASPIPKSLRRSRKKGKKKSKRKLFKKKGLRRKLLRITEDDSLFDDSSSGSSSEDSGSFSSSFSGDFSEEREEGGGDHGHRKILMINKKPTPSLPSFIFLPNVETPFYPPIGLPPPPIVPMYPMVPVPPVGPFFSGYHQVPCNDSVTSSSTPAVTTTTNGASTPESSTASTTETPSPDAQAGSDNPQALRSRKKSQKANKHVDRNKMLNKLREKLQRRNKQQDPYSNFSEQNPDLAYFNDFDQSLRRPMEFDPRNMFRPNPPIEDVDFKYLSQLIHKIDLNKTKPGIPFALRQRMADLPNRNFRRNYALPPVPKPMYNESAQKLRPASKADDDSYYSNLGRQIASMIRKIDTDGERQINIEIEHQNRDPMQTILNENRYAPRSYWERFVRSPLQRSQPSYMVEMNSLKNSNEHLFNLEDQVSVATTIERSLSLNELENIANIMEMTQLTRRQKSPKKVTPDLKRLTTSSRSYNINLLPRVTNIQSNVVAQAKDKNNIKIKQPAKESKIMKNRNNIVTVQYNNFMSHGAPQSQNSATLLNNINETHRNHSMHLETNHGLDFLGNILKSPQKTPLHQQVSRIVHKNVTNPNTEPSQQVVKYQLAPMMLNYRSLKYVGTKHNQYPAQHPFMPYKVPFYPKLASPTRKNGRPSSYYHHEMHHFDFFD